MNRSRLLLITIPLLILSVAISVSAQQRFGQNEPTFGREELREAIAVQEQYTPGLTLLSSRVVGTAVAADATGRGIVLVYLSSAVVPGIPPRLDGVTVRVETIGELVALKGPPGGGGGGGGDDGGEVDPTAKFVWPVPIGVSTGHPDITAGTIGARVTDGTLVYALSNNHVYANLQLVGIGMGDAVIQPGTFDGGSSPDDDIGTLWDWEPIVFCEAYPACSVGNVIDAAIAWSSTEWLGNATPSDGYGTPRSTTVDDDDVSFNMRVMKYGRTTGQTKGRISGINAIVNVGYGNNKVARFVNQIVGGGGGFSAGGDSGSLVVVEKGSDKGKAVGLLFAGSPNSTILNPINAVLGAFGVTIDGQ